MDWNHRVKLLASLLLGGTYPNYFLRAVSFSNQNVDGIARGLGTPPSPNAGAEHRAQFGSGLFTSSHRWAREPRQKQGGGRGIDFVNHEELFNPSEISIIPCQVVTCGHAGDHVKDGL